MTLERRPMVHDNPGTIPELVAAGRRPSVAARDKRIARRKPKRTTTPRWLKDLRS